MNKIIAVVLASMFAACADQCANVVDGTNTDVSCEVTSDLDQDAGTEE